MSDVEIKNVVGTHVVTAAEDAVAQHPNSHVEIGMSFVAQVCPSYLLQSNDCLVRVGRSLANLVALKDKVPLETSLTRIMVECDLISKGVVKVPKVRFGKTELQMPIVTLGCMRFQQEWGPRITNMNQVGTDCQDNLVAILKHAICDFGINHIETARGYGCSELQLGVALKQLMDTGVIQRKDIILQTKVGAMATAKDFRSALETSFQNLKVDYVDLFAFHGVNMDHQWDWLFNNGENGNNWDVIQEYVDAGKIRHVGFSTHGAIDLIQRLIETDKFQYCNLHYHYFGSYTNSGCGPYAGNLDMVRLLKEKDMGVFSISPYDKGGRLYAPSNKLRSLSLPDLEPMEFGSAWLWNHDKLDSEGAPIHTIVCGAARPSDLDMPAVAAYLQAIQPDNMLSKVKTVVGRLEQAQELAFGKEWLETCYTGIPKSNVSKHSVEHNQIIWMYNMIQAFGLWDFAKNRYQALESNLAKWDPSLSTMDSIIKVGIIGWGYVPGLSIQPGTDYSDDFESLPAAKKAKVIDAEEFVHMWCTKSIDVKQDSKNEGQSNGKQAVPVAPDEWQTAYDMRPWPDFPDRPSRA